MYYNYLFQGISIDNTSEYINYLLKNYPQDIVVHRAPYGNYWKDKIEMISVMHSIKFACIMMEVYIFYVSKQIDVDELWTSNQINTILSIFSNENSKRCMYFNCHYFITKKYVTITPNKPSHMDSYEWIRAWKYEYGDVFISHGPPILYHSNYKLYGNECYLHKYTENNGLVFTHYAYTEEFIVKFKENFYGSNKFSYKNWLVVNNYTVLIVFIIIGKITIRNIKIYYMDKKRNIC